MKKFIFWYYLYLAFRGKIGEEKILSLLDVLSNAQADCSKLGKQRICRIWEMYCRHNVLSAKLLQKAFSTPLLALGYLTNVGRRKKPWTDEEQIAILNLSAEQMYCLSRPLTSKYELMLLQTSSFETIDAYLQKFKLSLIAERLLITLATDGKDFRSIAVGYVNAHQGRVFQKNDAQELLFESRNCQEIQLALIEHSTMLMPLLLDSSIEHLIKHRSKKMLLFTFLSRSCIKNQQLVKLLKQSYAADKQMLSLLKISESRRNFMEYLLSHDADTTLHAKHRLRQEETHICGIFDPVKRRQEVMALVPKLQKGEVTPAMAGWIACNYPQLATIAETGTKLFLQHIKTNMLYFDALKSQFYKSQSI